MVISCNPDPDHKIAEMISWWLDEDGFPIEERAGVIRWFILQGGQYLWGDTPEELKATYGDNVKPISFSFIGSNIRDNPRMLEQNSDYLAWLEGLNPIDKARLLDGNWKVRPLNSLYFNRDWCAFADAIPLGSAMVRAYDKAGTAPSDKDKNPDFTASIGMAKSKDGYYYIFGNYHPKFKDDDSDVLGVFRKTVGERDNIIELQARQDGTDVTIIFPKDPSAAGKFEFIESAKKLQNIGYTVKADPMPSNKSKMVRFAPFASACENGLVKFVISTFDKNTLNNIYKCLEQFTGERSTRSYKDDIPDCVASAYNALNTMKVYTVPKLGAFAAPPPSVKAIALADI
jgi:phage terminase large subunit-like protein